MSWNNGNCCCARHLRPLRKHAQKPMTTQLYDPTRDPFEDFLAALAQARAEKKHILVEVGGDWCVWCGRLETFITSHADLAEARSRYYVTVKVYSGDDPSCCWDFINRLPDHDSLPQFIVYDTRSKVLCSQPTDPFEVGESYEHDKVLAFLQTWKP